MSLCARRATLVVCLAFLLPAVRPNAAIAQGAGDSAAVPSTVAPHRPVALVPLYASFATLQALDVDSTLRAVTRGGREGNPVLSGLISSPTGLMAMKAGTTAAVFVATEHLRKHNPKTAVVVMIGLNSALAVVAAHNYAVVRGSR
jgi:hypothetical protein